MEAKCESSDLILTISDLSGKLLENTKVLTLKKLTASSGYENKYLSNEKGKVTIPFAENTGFVWLQKGGFNDVKTIIEKCSAPETNDSETQVNIETNPDISYMGEFWNFNDGSGIPVAIIVDGKLQNNGVIKLITKSNDVSSFHYEETYSISQGFPKHLFNLDYPFEFDTEYTLTAINGDLSTTTKWIPLPSSTSFQKANDYVPPTQNSRIIITGETNPVITKGMIFSIPYQVEVTGVLEENYQVGGKGGWLERCSDVMCSSFDKSFMISETSRTYEFKEDFSYYWELDEQFRELSYDPKPKVIQLVFRFGEDTSSFNIYPEWKNLNNNFEISEDSLLKINTKSSKVIKYMEAGMQNRWFMMIEVCSGENDLQKPTIIVSSDVETTQYTLNKSINALSCAREEVQVKAINPISVQVGLERLDVDAQTNTSEFDELKSELAELRKMLEEKESKPKVPGWVKNNVQWWAEGKVDDQTFTQGIGHLIKQKVIDIPVLPEQSSDVSTKKIPDWIRNNAVWWSEGAISEDDFINGIEFLVQNGIISVE